MTDPRLTPHSGRVALETLRGQIAADSYTAGAAARISAPLADLLRKPGGPRDRQLLLGAGVTVIERQDGTVFVQALADGYCGWLDDATLGPDHPVSHRVSVPATHLYPAPDFKRPAVTRLSLNAQCQITDAQDRFLRTAQGFWLPEQHLAPLNEPASDPVAVAESLLGTPYLWGGNARDGIDCSGLVQLALHACNRPCPGDSDLQEKALGHPLPPGTPPQRGDLLFWRGHVAWVSAPDTILHANAHSMSVAFEPLDTAIARIAPDSPVTAHRRL